MSADLPPEAYTRDTLQAAFDWLQTQPDVVRASVHTPERLVSLYRRAQRLNDNDHPVSSKKFVTELKSLASSLDQFNGQPERLEPQPPQRAQPHPPQQAQAQPSAEASRPPASPQAKAPEFPQSPPPAKTSPEPSPAPPVDQPPPEAQSPVTGAGDAVTESRITEVQKRFNLSSREESLRLLVSLGYEKFTQIP